MKQKLLVRMFGAILLVVTFSHGHATRCSLSNRAEKPVSETLLSAPALHFSPLDMFKW